MLTKPRQRAFHHPSLAAKAGAVRSALLRNQRPDPPAAELVTRRLPLVATVCNYGRWPASRPPALAAHRRDRLDEGDKLEAIVAVGGGEQAGERDAGRVADQLVLGAGLAPVDRAGPSFGAPKTAGRCEESTTARDLSCSRPQQVIPEPQPISWGSCSQGRPVFRTNRTPSAPCDRRAACDRHSGSAVHLRDQRLDDLPQLVTHERLRHRPHPFAGG